MLICIYIGIYAYYIFMNISHKWNISHKTNEILPFVIALSSVQSLSRVRLSATPWTAALAKAKKQKPKCPPTDGWIDKTMSIFTREYYSTWTRNETVTQATIRMNPDNIMWKQAGHQGSHTGVFHLEETSRMGEPMETESKSVVAREEGNGEWLLMDMELLFRVMKMFWN